MRRPAHVACLLLTLVALVAVLALVLGRVEHFVAPVTPGAPACKGLVRLPCKPECCRMSPLSCSHGCVCVEPKTADV